MSKTESKNSCICPFIWINPSNLLLKFVQNSMCNPSDEPTDPGEHMKSFAGVMIQSDVIQKMMRTIKILNCLTKKKQQQLFPCFHYTQLKVENKCVCVSCNG